MSTKSIWKPLVLSLVIVAAIVFVSWNQIADAFGPMSQAESQCLICHREHLLRQVCGATVRDEIKTNEYSDWIDTFTPPEHPHVWVGHTQYHRAHWFGGTSIACGGIPTIPTIYRQRAELGEQSARQLAKQFQDLVQQQATIDFSTLDRFTKTVNENPASLIVNSN